MAINIFSNEMTDCGTGVKITGNVDVDVFQNRLTRVETAVDIAEHKSWLAQLGLPPSTDPNIVLEALAILNGVRAEPEAVQAYALKGSRLAVELLSIGSSLVTVLPFLRGLLP